MDVFDSRTCQLGEGPFFDEQLGRVGWVDITGHAVLWRELDSGRTGGTDTGADVGAAVPRVHGGLVLCLPDGPVSQDPDGVREPLGTFADADAAAPGTPGVPAEGAPPGQSPPGALARRSNDAKADPAGRLWVGTVTYDQRPGAAALYRLDPGASAPVRMLGGLTIGNGLGWSPDGSLMYYVDTPTGRVDVFDFDSSRGEIAGRRVFAEIDEADGAPDGLCVDAAGGVWVALWGGGAVRRYTPDGALDRIVPVPTPLVTSCAFVGPAYDLLVVTTASVYGPEPGAGVTYLHRPDGVVGLPAHRFAG